MAAAKTSRRPRETARTSPVETAILTATSQLLEEVTARDLSVAQILERSSVSRATFYHYFSSKWEVVNYLAASVMQQIFEQVQRFTADIETVGDTPSATPAQPNAAAQREALRLAIVDGCSTWARNRGVFRAVLDHWREVPDLRALLVAVLQPFQTALARRLDIERAAGRAPEGPDSSAVIAALLWSSLSCLHVASLPDVQEIQDEDQAATLLTTIWMRTLYAELPSE